MKAHFYNQALNKRFYKHCAYKKDGVPVVNIHKLIMFPCGTQFCKNCKHFDDTFKRSMVGSIVLNELE